MFHYLLISCFFQQVLFLILTIKLCNILFYIIIFYGYIFNIGHESKEKFEGDPYKTLFVYKLVRKLYIIL